MIRDPKKYLVVKWKDAEQALGPADRATLMLLAGEVDAYRQNVGKHPMECVVVERDWPEYEQVWQLLAARLDGKPLTTETPTTPALVINRQLLEALKEVVRISDRKHDAWDKVKEALAAAEKALA